MKEVKLTVTEKQLHMICNAVCKTQYELYKNNDADADIYKDLAIELIQICLDAKKEGEKE